MVLKTKKKKKDYKTKTTQKRDTDVSRVSNVYRLEPSIRLGLLNYCFKMLLVNCGLEYLILKNILKNLNSDFE